jgi:FHA domain
MTLEQVLHALYMQSKNKIDKELQISIERDTATFNEAISQIRERVQRVNTETTFNVAGSGGCDVENVPVLNQENHLALRDDMIMTTTLKHRVNHTTETGGTIPFGTTQCTSIPRKPSESSITTVGSTSITANTKHNGQQKDATVRVDIIGGPYEGQVFYLKPTPRSACMIGRSSSKKFVVNGISLSKDLEVSTTHGKIDKTRDGTYSYSDTGSTNGSFLKDSGYHLQAHEPIEIPASNSGIEIIIGETVLHITIL